MTRTSGLSWTLCCAGLLFAAAHALCQSAPAVRHQRVGGDALWGIASGASGLVAVGTNGAILHSTDGQAWVRRSSGTADWLTAVAYGSGRYIAVGDRGRILSSSDGAIWVNVPHSVTTHRLNNIISSGTGFLAVGEAGTIVRSDDGTVWESRPSGTTRWLRGVSEFGTVITGEGGIVLRAVLGGWAVAHSGTGFDLEAVTSFAQLQSGSFNNNASDTQVFAATGIGAGITLLKLRYSGPTGTLNVSPSLETAIIPVATTSRIRCIVSGPIYRTSVFNEFAGTDVRSLATPLVAVDESGHVFSQYESPVWRSPFDAPTAWAAEKPDLGAGIHAGVYSAPQVSFFFVGSDETITQRDQVFAGRLGNIAARGLVDQGERALVAGFVVTGTTPKSVLLRGAGPALANFGIRNALGGSALTLFDSAGNSVAGNSKWSGNANAAAIAAAATAAGAFPFAAGSDDNALLMTLSPGTYTAQLAASNRMPGVGLIEVYDLDARASGTSRAINLSTRGEVGPGENALVAGLVVQGPTWRTFLIRAVGPTLATFGISGALADPVIAVASNLASPASRGINIYREAELVRRGASAIGAFVLSAGSQDDVLVATLPPANYTLTVSSKSNATGVALLEIYEVGVNLP